MALDYAMNADFRRMPDPDNPEDVATVGRALTIHSEAVLAGSSTDGDVGLPVDLSRVQGATLVRCAEAAVDYVEDTQAAGALAAYFREDPPRDQYFVRALFVQAQLRAREANTNYNGLVKLTVLREALAFVIQALTIAEEAAVAAASDPAAFGFLVYNASVHHWAVVRSLLREGSKSHAIPSFTRIIEALNKVDDRDYRWRARNALALATCHGEIGELEKAASLANSALELLAKLPLATPGSADYALIEDAARVRSHFTALQDLQSAVEGGSTGKAATLSPVIFGKAATASASGKPEEDVRARILATLQPMLTASTPGAIQQGSGGLSFNVGRGPNSLLTATFGTAAPNAAGAGGAGATPAAAVASSASSSSSTSSSATPLPGSGASVTAIASNANKETVRAKLLEFVKILRPASHGEYVFRKAEADLGILKMALPDFKQSEDNSSSGAAAAQSSRAGQTGVAASTSTTATTTSTIATTAAADTAAAAAAAAIAVAKGRDMDVIAMIAQVAVNHGLWDVAHAAVHAVHADKNTSPAARILADVIDAQLLVGCLSLQDAHQTIGHFVEIPLDVINTLALKETGDAAGNEGGGSNSNNNGADGAGGGGGKPKMRTRRQSVAAAMSVAFVPRRSSSGKALMQPGGIPFGKPIPKLTPTTISSILEARRLASMKFLRRALVMSRNYGNAYLVELASTVAWNISLPLLRARTRSFVFPTLQAAADALGAIDSPLVQLRVRLHLEIARGMSASDMLTNAGEHLSMALALDYGGLRADPHYGSRFAPIPIPGKEEDNGHNSSNYDYYNNNNSALSTSVMRRGLSKGRGGGGGGGAGSGSNTELASRELSSQRPLDRYILPLVHATALAGAVYDNPSDALDQAAVTISQAKAASDPFIIGSLLGKAASQIDIGLATPPEQAAGWKKLRSPSFCVTASPTAAVIWNPSVNTATTLASGTSQVMVSANASGGGAVNIIGLPAMAPGEAGGARRKQGHRLWMTIAEIATQAKQWDLVVRAAHEVRGYNWDPLASRDMVLLQAKADLLFAEASAAKAKEYNEGMMEEKCRDAADTASRQQVKRVQVAAMKLRSGVGVMAGVNKKAKSRPSTSSGNAANEERKKAEAEQDGTAPPPTKYWWDDVKVTSVVESTTDDAEKGSGSAAGGGVAASASITMSEDGEMLVASAAAAGDDEDDDDDPYAHLEVQETDEQGLLLSPPKPLANMMPNAEALPLRAPRQYVASETGRPPGWKLIPNDAHALGLLVPGCPLALTAWKTRLLASLNRAMRRGVALGAPWIVETACIRLWNYHSHIWQTNDYGFAVLPMLIEALTDALQCLLGVWSTNVALFAKIAHVVARYHEENARAALVDEALGIPPGSPAYIGINGAVLVDFQSLTPEEGTLTSIFGMGNALSNLSSPITNDDKTLLYGRIFQVLPSASSHCISLAERTLSMLFGIPVAAFPMTSRRDCIALRGRLRLLQLVGHGVPSLLVNTTTPTPSSSPAAAVSSTPTPVANTAASTTTLTTPNATQNSITAVAATTPSSALYLPPIKGASLLDALTKAGAGEGFLAPEPGSPSTWPCPDYGSAVALLQISGHSNVAWTDKVSALRAAINLVEKASTQLAAAVVDACGPDPEGGNLAAAIAAQQAASASRPNAQTAGKPPGTAAAGAAKPTTAAGGTKPGATSSGAGSAAPGSPGRGSIVPVISTITAEVRGANDIATFSTQTTAANEAKRAEMTKANVTALTELWARCARIAVDLAFASIRLPLSVIQPVVAAAAAAAPVAGVPPTPAAATTSPASPTPPQSSPTSTTTPAVASLNDPDLSLLTDAQRCAASAIALVPSSNPLAIDELGSLFGLRGHGYDAYRLELGPTAARVLQPNAEMVDVYIGKLSFRHRFNTGADGSVMDGAGKGGYSNVFKWWCVAEMAWGQAVSMLVNPDRQNIVEQDNLRRAALDHLTSAGEWAAKIKDTSLVLGAAFLTWNLAIPLASSPVTRTPLTKPLLRLLSALSSSGATHHDAYSLRAELYCLLLQCYVDDTAWMQGLKAVEEAFTALPVAYQDRLWNYRLTFQSKLGMDVTQALAALKSKSPLLQARLWSSLARLAALPADQSSAYLSALETLTGMFTRGYVLIDYAEWLHSNHMPVSDVRDALHGAADIFLEVISPATDGGDAGGGGDGGTHYDGSSIGGGGSVMRSSVNMKSTTRNPRASTVRGGGGGASVAIRSSIAYSKPPPSIRGSQVTRMSGSLTSGSALREQQEEPSDWPLRPEASHYDALTRVLVHLALVAESGVERARYLVLAAEYIAQVWDMTRRTANRAAAEKHYFKMKESDRSKITTDYATWLEDQVEVGPHVLPTDWAGWATWWPQVCSQLKHVEGNGDGAGVRSTPEQTAPTTITATNTTRPPSTAPGATKPPSGAAAAATTTVGLGAPTSIPAHHSSASEVAAEACAKQYVALRQAVGALPSAHASFAITKAAIRRPALSIYILTWLCDQLISTGYLVHAAPVLALFHTFSADLLDPPATRLVWGAVALSKSAAWAETCNYREAAASLYAHLSTSGALTLTDTDRRAYEAEVVLLDLGHARREASLTSARSTSPVSGNTVMVSAVVSKKFKAALRSGNMIAGIRSMRRRAVSGGEVRVAWVELANVAALRGQARGARQLLLESWRHAESFHDYATQWKVRVAQAQVAADEGDGRGAVELLLQATCDVDGAVGTGPVADAAEWMRVITLLVQTLVSHHLYSDAKAALTAAMHALDASIAPKILNIPDITPAQLALLEDRSKDLSKGLLEAAKADVKSNTTLEAAAAATAATKRVLSTMPDTAVHPSTTLSTEADIDATCAAVRVRLLFADVHTREAIRTRKVGGSWVHDWRSADATYAEAADLCRAHGLDSASPLLAESLWSHAQAILACPGADPDAFPAIGNDGAFTSVAEGSDEILNRFRASTPVRRARLLYLALACKLLHEANQVSTAWASSTSIPGVPANMSSYAYRLSCKIACGMVAADALCSEEEDAASIAAERALYSGMSSDPVALYLHQAEASAAGPSSGAVRITQATATRATLALEAATAALSSAPATLPRDNATALAAYGVALTASMRATALSMQFTTHVAGTPESLLAACGAVELDHQIWDTQSVPAPPPSEADIAAAQAAAAAVAAAAASASNDAVATATTAAHGSSKSRPGSAATKAAAATAASTKGGKLPATSSSTEAAAAATFPATPVAGGRAEFVPFADTSASTTTTASSHEAALPTTVASLITTLDPSVELPSTVVPQQVRGLHQQALFALQQALEVAVHAGVWDAAKTAASTLVDCYGSVAPTRAVTALALAQACDTRQELRSVFVTAAGHSSRQVLHMNLVERLEREYLHPQDAPVHTAALKYLQENSIAWRMMDCNRSAEDIMAMLPERTRVLILQRSTSGRVLYAGVLTRNLNHHQNDDNVESEKISGAISRMILTEEMRASLSQLAADAAAIRVEYAANVRSYGEDMGPEGEFVSPPAATPTTLDGEDGGHHTTTAVLPPSSNPRRIVSATSSRDACEARVQDIIKRMNTFLEPLLGSSSPLAPWLGGKHPIIMCVERSLASLPLEALSGGIAESVNITRDFSLQVLGHRLAAASYLRASGGVAAGAAASVDGSLTSHTCNVALSGFTYVADAKYEDLRQSVEITNSSSSSTDGIGGDGSGATTPADRHTILEALSLLTNGTTKPTPPKPAVVASPSPPPPGTAGSKVPPTTAASAATTHVAPPAATETPLVLSSPSLIELLHGSATPSLKDIAGNPIASTWRGFRGDEHIASPAAWQEMLRKTSFRPDPSGAAAAFAGGAMLYYGHGRLFAHLPPEYVAGLLAPGVRLAFLADTFSTNTSARKQAIVDNTKINTEGRLALEDTWETVALLTLAGVGTVVAQSWSITHHAAEALVLGALGQALHGAVPVSQAVRTVFANTTSSVDATATATTAEDTGANTSAAAASTTTTTSQASLIKSRVRYATVVYGVPHTTVVYA